MAGVAYSAALLSCRRVFLASRALAQYQTRFVPLKHHRFPAVRSPIVNWSCRWFGCINVFGEELSSGEAQKLLLDMKQEDGYLKHTPNEELLAKIMRAFMVSSFVVERAKELGVAPQEVPAVTQRLREKIRNNSKGRDQLVNHLKMAMQTGGEAAAIEQVLWPLFVQVAYNDFPQFSEAMNEATHLNQLADMRQPGSWYPKARSMRRKLIFHMGPTNSGKTFQALRRYRDAQSGVYAAPLRLLAMEVWDQCNQEGTYCSLITGQETRELPFSEHVACTVEMVDVRRAVEVAVIDEIQMMSDRSRGWAWTRALYGVPAREVHVCGDPTAKPLLEQAARLLGDRLEIKTYQRITPLGIAPRPLSSYKEVQPGDCVVAFSRKDIFEIKSEIEQHTRHKCCVVYGALPPETRRQQAKLFNDTASGYDVLVASDAIGMGLNLNIRRVIFHRLSKYGERGQGMIPVPPAQVKQIAGRAGRHGTEWDHGWVTCRYKEDLPALFEGMSSPPTPATAAGLFPILDQVAAFASQLPKESLHAVFSKFMENAQHDGHFFICNHQESLRLAELLEQVPGLSLSERFCFMVAPVNTKDSMMCDALADFASQYAIGEGVRLRISEPGEVPQDTSALQRLEFQYQVVSLYQWLANRLQDVKDLESQRVLFHDRELAENMASTVSRILGDGLRNIQPVFGRKQPLIPNKLRSDTEGHALSHGSLAKIQLRRIT